MPKNKKLKGLDRFTYPLNTQKSEETNLYRQKKSEVEAILKKYSEQTNSENLRSGSDLLILENIPEGGVVKNQKISHIKRQVIDLLVLINCDLTHSIFKALVIDTLILINTDISDASFHGAKFNKVILSQTLAKNSDFSDVEMSHSWLEGNFENSNFQNSRLNQSVLKGNFQNVTFAGAILKNSWLRECNMRKSNFTNARVSNMTLDIVATGVNSVTLPDGSKHIPMENDWEKFTRISDKP